MIELSQKIWSVDLPYSLRLHGVTDEKFDELVDEDTRAELINGVLVVHSPASLRHDDVTGFLISLTRLFVEAKELGKVHGPEAIVHLATSRKFAPDLFFVTKDRVPVNRRQKQFEGAPDFIIEVLSPSNRSDDLEDKRPAYQEAGVPEIWFIDPAAEEIIIDRKRKRRYVTSSAASGKVAAAAIPGFWIDADWLWSEPLPKVMPCVRKLMGDE